MCECVSDESVNPGRGSSIVTPTFRPNGGEKERPTKIRKRRNEVVEVEEVEEVEEEEEEEEGTYLLERW